MAQFNLHMAYIHTVGCPYYMVHYEYYGSHTGTGTPCIECKQRVVNQGLTGLNMRVAS